VAKSYQLAYRNIQTDYWMNVRILKWPFKEKAFYMYLLTNPRITYCGIFDFPMGLAKAETNLSEKEIKFLLLKMQNEYERIVWSEATEEVCILHWMKYNTFNDRQKTGFDNALKAVRNKKLIEYLMGIDRVSIGCGEGMHSDSHNNTLNHSNTLSNTLNDSVPKNDEKELIIDKWNEVEGLAHIDCIDHKRLELFNARINEKGFDAFVQMIENVKKSPLLLGKVKGKDGKAPFKATFDWCIIPNNFQKVLDGNYIDVTDNTIPWLDDFINNMGKDTPRKIGEGN